MKNTRKGKAAAMTAATLAISLLIGTGISEAMRLTSGNRAGGMRATAIRAQSFGAKSSHMSINRARAMRATAIRAKSFGGKSGHVAINRAWVKRARVVGAQSVAREGRHNLLRGLALFGEIGHVGDHFHGADNFYTRAVLAARGNYFQVLPIRFPGRTIQWPSGRIPDPSDIPGWEDLEHFPGRDMINSKYLGGPDREYNPARDGTRDDYERQMRAADISDASCMWDEATWDKVTNHWGSPGGPLVGDTTSGNWKCDEPYVGLYHDNKGGSKDNGSGGTDNSGSTSDTKKKETKETTAEAKVVKEDDGKKGDNGGTGTEGDDPDELRSPIAEEMEAIDMLSGYDLRDRRSGKNGGPSFPTYGNTPVGLPGHEQRLGPDHKNRPDVTASPASGLTTANPMSYAASPTPDGGSNPPPGPEYNPVASTTSAAAGSTIANRMGYASSPAIGTGGKDPSPPPGPEF